MGQKFEFYRDNRAINILAVILALSPSLSLKYFMTWRTEQLQKDCISCFLYKCTENVQNFSHFYCLVNLKFLLHVFSLS